ncbi:MAG: hypothetical protein ACFFD5_13895 [Candidatus Thorarchaeota archaeon]
MGLDKWIKTDRVEKKSDKKPKSQKIKQANQVKRPERPLKLSKYILLCTKCKYQKTLMKKDLEESDRICPKCKNKMKIK